MFEGPFRSGSAVHFLALAACALGVLIYGVLARQHREGRHPWLAKALAAGCITAWIINTVTALTSKHFSWETSLPLYYCNWANLLGAAVLLTRSRTAESLLYYWACGLTVWAFITPTLEFGPTRIGFWIFWGYHLCIALAVCHLLVADRFRPTLKDWLVASAITILYGLALLPINVHFGWNYAFLGQTKPHAPTPIEALGTWPLRLVWLALLAIVVFFLLTAPWLACQRIRRASEKS
ncbi:MAG: TIGR02206 family membrane protein [Verrucomicrobiae bacterium]|nr:TIGR02206 family membrane protein [Verrucomicrobiae bacterium]